MKAIGICADDFGLSSGIDAGVIELVAAGRLSAVACMSRAPAWRADAARLAALDVDMGVHLSFTEPTAGDWHMGLPVFIGRALLGLLPQQRLRAEIKAQLDAFEDAAGRAPDFIDGHQHVHQLPHVRDALMTEVTERYASHRPWLRDTRPPRGRSADAPDARKQRIIAALGAKGLARLAAILGLRQNRDLVGVYGFEGDAATFRERLGGWLDEAGEGTLLMAHPGVGAPAAGDGIAAARLWEHEVLASDAFAAMLTERGLVVRRLSSVLA
ncbi:MAG: ChbG/HpnK family deacetylase [Paucibacter sp.]|nr:ChbG/HpnK family deacetylase [Roseateles sp.]